MSLWVLRLTDSILYFPDVLGAIVAIFILVMRWSCLRERIRLLFRFWCMRWIPRLVCRLLGPPFDSDLIAFRDAAKKRYPNAVNCQGVVISYHLDKSIDFLDKIVDREINKARGILPFNSIMMAVIGHLNWGSVPDDYHFALTTGGKLIHAIERDIFIAFLISSILLLEMFWVHWDSSEVYTSKEDETDHTCVLIRNRALILDTSIIISFFAVLGVAVVWFSDGIKS